MTALVLNHINVFRNKQHILKDIHLTFESGSLTVLLGPNGAGKSTLLNTICDDLPYQGSIACFDRPIEDWSRESLAKHLGVLPQASSLSFNFTAEEVVNLGSIPLSASQQQCQTWVNDAMTLTDTLMLAKHPYPRLSGGEKQRVHLSRVLVQLSQSQQQEILLLDEPTSALDIQHQHNTLALARQKARQGACVIIVLHDLNLAAQYSDRIIIMKQGEIVADGDPWQALTQETIESIYQTQVEILPHPHHQHPMVISCAKF